MDRASGSAWPADIADALARRASRLGGFGGTAEWHETVGSTNDLADARAATGAPHGMVIAAHEQTTGRGRLGRSWYSPPGSGLYVSVVLRPRLLFGDPGTGLTHYVNPGAAVTLTAGVALAGALRAATGLPVHIKWPNDLVVERRKVCGILAEASAAAGSIEHIVLGFGINIGEASYPPDIAARATSLERECGRPIDRALVLAESLASLAEALRDLRTNGFAIMLDRWRHWSPSSTGTPVDVVGSAGEWMAAITAGVADDGALLVNVNGETQRVIAGEIRWK